MKKRLAGLLILMALASNAAYGVSEEGAKNLLTKYKTIKTYAIELREENAKLSQEVKEMKDLLIEEYNIKIENMKAEGKEVEEDLNIGDKTLLEIYKIIDGLYAEDKMEVVEEMPAEEMMEEAESTMEAPMENEAVKEDVMEEMSTETMEEEAE